MVDLILLCALPWHFKTKLRLGFGINFGYHTNPFLASDVEFSQTGYIFVCLHNQDLQ